METIPPLQAKISWKSTVKLARNQDFYKKYSPILMCVSAIRDQALTHKPPHTRAPVHLYVLLVIDINISEYCTPLMFCVAK